MKNRGNNNGSVSGRDERKVRNNEAKAGVRGRTIGGDKRWSESGEKGNEKKDKPKKWN